MRHHTDFLENIDSTLQCVIGVGILENLHGIGFGHKMVGIRPIIEATLSFGLPNDKGFFFFCTSSSGTIQNLIHTHTRN